ncbi:hypothetical protein [Draconibacterium mangrovi]|uniref:hypothetical protein n=1 Tax=Draconibacterium mangrovi TaxID=2697469 RepID=UPI0013D50B2B|nr:hypothetical protein [Draconibacterium mangrovi]
MKAIKEIPLFKIALVTIAIIALIIFNNFSKNGRYQVFDNNEIMDTRTGYIYDIRDHDLKYHSFPE